MNNGAMHSSESRVAGMPRRSSRPRTRLHLAFLAVGLLLLSACGSTGPQEGEASLEVSVVGGGFVVVGDFSCKGTQTCTWTGDPNRPVRFLTVPVSGNVLGQWSGDCEAAGIATECVIPTPGEASGFGATFVRHVLRLDVSGDGEGTFRIVGGGIDETCDSDCAVIVNEPVQVAITLQEAANTIPGDWGGACSGATLDDYCLVTVSGATTVSKDLALATPSLSLTKVGTFDDGGDGTADVDDTIDYTFTITNDGTVTLTNITLTDPLATITGGPITTLAPGTSDTTTYTATYAITQADIDAGEVINTATADSNQTPPTNDSVTTTLPQDASLTLTKVGTFDDGGDGTADVDDTIDYTFTITNDGTVTLTNITLTDPLATITGGPITTLAPGTSDTTTYTATYAITQADIDAGEVINTATADSNQTPPTNDSVTTTLPQDASLTLTKVGTFDDGGDGTADVDDTIDYTFTITNDGTVTLTNITLTDPLATITGGPITTLAPGTSDTTTYTATYAITQADIDAGEVINTATADSNQTPPINDSVTTTLPQDASLTLTKVGTFDDGGDGTADVDDTIDYTFTITNDGTVTLTNITLTDPLATITGGPITTLAPGTSDTTTYTATYAITQADIDAGEVINTATANSDQTDPTNDSVTVTLGAGP